MTDTISHNPIRAGLPWHPLILGVPSVCFVTALVTDIAYMRTYDFIWNDFSAWLLAVGIVLGALAAIVGIIDLARPSVRVNRLIWPYAAVYAIAMILGLFDNFVHSRDAYGVMPAGLTLSVLTVLALAVTAIIGAVLIHRGRNADIR